MKFKSVQLLSISSLMVSGVLAFSSCSPGEKYPIEPLISNSSYTFSEDEFLTLKFSFTDGDADVGLSQLDTLAPFDRNLYVDYKEMQGDDKFVHVVIPATTDTQYFNYRIPLLNSDGSRKSIKGEIEVQIDLSLRTSNTIKLELYILDKALHKSNTLSIGPIVLPD